ncbi:MAG: hypothetical protein P8099_11370 [Gemmatimonadota bacterium]
MAELYQRQGLHDRAVRIYQRLLRTHPGDRRLKGRLEDAEMARRLAAAQTAEGREHGPVHKFRQRVMRVASRERVTKSLR